MLTVSEIINNGFIFICKLKNDVEIYAKLVSPDIIHYYHIYNGGCLGVKSVISVEKINIYNEIKNKLLTKGD